MLLSVPSRAPLGSCEKSQHRKRPKGARAHPRKVHSARAVGSVHGQCSAAGHWLAKIRGVLAPPQGFGKCAGFATNLARCGRMRRSGGLGACSVRGSPPVCTGDRLEAGEGISSRELTSVRRVVDPRPLCCAGGAAYLLRAAGRRRAQPSRAVRLADWRRPQPRRRAAGVARRCSRAAAAFGPSPTSSSAQRKVKTPPSRLLRESRSVRLRAFAAAKHVLRWRARIARAALARLRLGLLSLLMLERPRDGAIDVEPERVHVHLVGEHGGTTDCSSCRAAQGRALTSDAGGRRRDGQGYALDAA
jgi:hypothetical protein